MHYLSKCVAWMTLQRAACECIYMLHVGALILTTVGAATVCCCAGGDGCQVVKLNKVQRAVLLSEEGHHAATFMKMLVTINTSLKAPPCQ